MKLAAIITEEQAKTLKGECYCGSSRFNPQKDGNGDIFISEREVKNTDNPKFWWVGNLPLTEYVEPEEKEVK